MGPISASTDPGALVVILDELAAAPDPELRRRLGPELDDRLRHVLRERALAWARRAGGGADPLQAATAADLAPLLAGHDGPVLVVAPDVPGLAEQHLVAALDDLADGTLLTRAPTGDGTAFLVGIARPEPELLARVAAPFDELVATTLRLGGELGMLRAERRLVSVGDARALLADPLAPRELRDLLVALS